jgi:hypothetical protein
LYLLQLSSKLFIMGSNFIPVHVAKHVSNHWLKKLNSLMSGLGILVENQGTLQVLGFSEFYCFKCLALCIIKVI